MKRQSSWITSRTLVSVLADILEIRFTAADEIETDPPPPTKGQKTRIIVKIPDGAVIYRRFAADTFADAIERLGVERVKNLGKVVNARPLVSDTPSSGTTADRKRGNVYIYTGNMHRPQKTAP